jgi:hypothetical protein
MEEKARGRSGCAYTNSSNETYIEAFIQLCLRSERDRNLAENSRKEL